MRSSFAAACRWSPLRNAAAYAGILSTILSWDGGSINRRSESSTASKKYWEGAPEARLMLSASHHVSGAN